MAKNLITLKPKTIHLIGRTDQVMRDYFSSNIDVQQILAKDLMPLFVEKGIFKKDVKLGKPIRDLLRLLDSVDRLEMFKHCTVVRKAVNRSWWLAR